ncbi:hypothetical protein Tco_0559122 [Tanacetum coccineum]
MVKHNKGFADAPIITTAVSESDVLSAVHLRVVELEKYMSDLKKIYISAKALAQIPESSKKQTPTVDLEQGSEKSASKILKIKREQAEKQQTPKLTVKSTDKATLQKYDQKSALYQIMHANKKHDDDEDPPTGPNQGKKTKRRRTKESESSKKPSSTKETLKGKAPSKGSKTGKSASAKEPVKEPIAEVVMDVVGDNVVHDDDQPQDTSKPKTTKTLNPEWLEWNNPEGDHYPFDMSKPLPLQGHPGYQTVVAYYLFNNDLEYLKSPDPERTYTTSITKTKAARYEIEGIEDMVPTL